MEFHFAAQPQMIIQGKKVFKPDSVARALWLDLYQQFFLFIRREAAPKKYFILF
jgi:hypothetical protein